MDGFKTAKYPRLAKAARKFFEDYNIFQDSYGLTYVPGETELTAYYLGLDPKYETRTRSDYPEFMPSEDAYKDTLVWERLGKKFTEVVPKEPELDYISPIEPALTYRKEESPLSYQGQDSFTVNPETAYGKELQDRLNYAFTRSVNRGDRGMDINPDTGKLMYKGEEQLLGSVYFNELGEFEDRWDLGVDWYEPIAKPINILRRLGEPLLEMNVPVVRGTAKYIGEE